ncbi:MAG TPA: DNA repair protein RecN [Burkholderiales bacterium]|nr:DNA repair protein RecN [Burkholderiales bacterium]
MLRLLAIRDFVIVEKMDLEFGPGFTVLTGETGAGKSILIDALAMVLGERSDAGVVRHSAQRAEIAAEFDIADAPGLEEWLAENELAGDAGTCLLRRVIDASGRSRALVNGHPCTLGQLREAGEFLVDIHGQHAHQSLLRPATQRNLLDGYGSLTAQAGRVAQQYRHWRELAERLRAVEQDAARLENERDEVSFRVHELHALDVGEGEWATLQADHSRLSHAASLLESANLGIDVLADGEAACLSRLATVSNRIALAAEHDPALGEVLDLLESARVEVQEAVYALRHYGERVDLDPARLAQVERRLEAIHDAARKYRVTPDELQELLERSRLQLELLTDGLDPESIRRQEAQARDAYECTARLLSGARQHWAPQLSEKVTAAMQTLAMAGGRFEVVLDALEGGGAQGLEDIEFQVSAHTGLPARALAKVASGGELSRLSLAIQTATSEVARVPTLIFDEVDVGIGGGVAEIVGRLLKDLGRRHQVMCVTHLPQVAAAGDVQWRVVKSRTDDGVASAVETVAGAERVDEIARMLGGVRITATTRRHAEEMLAQAGAPPDAAEGESGRRKGERAGRS